MEKEVFWKEAIQSGLPHYVSARRSIRVGLAASLIVLCIGCPTIYLDQREQRKAPSPIARNRWMLFLGILLWLSSFTGDFVRNKVYTFDMIALNKQHFANVHWLREYKNAIS